MKTTALLLFFFLSGYLLMAQSSSFEFAYTGTDTTTEGPSISNKTVYFSLNSNNPSGNTFIIDSSFTVTFSFSNQQYSTGSLANQYNAGLLFGAMAPGGSGTGQPAPYRFYTNMGSLSNVTNSFFTSINGSTGGIEAEDGTFSNRNFAIELFSDVKYLGTNSNAGRYYYGDLTLSFSKPVSNPVLQIGGLGAQFNFAGGTIGFSTELELLTGGVTLSLLDGNGNLAVTGMNIENTATVKNATGGAASGSVLISGSGISTLTFKLYVEGDGQTTHINWNEGANARPGDGFLIGVSTPNFTTLPITLERFTTTGSGCKVKVDFRTGVEDNVHYIRLQHSNTQNGSFRDIYEWQPKGDNSSYQYLHSTSSPMNFYRLAVTDNDSSKSYSTVSFAAGCQRSFSVYPNPAATNINITGQFRNTTYRLGLFDSKGRLVLQTAITGDRDLYNLNISRLPPGNYYIQLNNADAIVLSGLLIKK